jgi:transcriptional antiterminator RfaH
MAPQVAGLFPPDLFDSEEAQVGGDGSFWQVFYTRARHEKVFSRQLAAKSAPHYLPLIERPRVSRSRKLVTQAPLFPGYVFVFWPGPGTFRMATIHVSRILRVDDPPRLWAELKQVHLLIRSGAPLSVEERLVPGSRVRVRSGALEGTVGVVENRRGKTRLTVAITMLQRAVCVEVDDSALERIE